MDFNIGPFLAKKVLDRLGLKTPSQQEIDLIDSLLSHAVIRQKLFFPPFLTEQEKACLLLAAKGNTARETANILNATPEAVSTYRRSIKRKLKASSMAQAVFEGLIFNFYDDLPLVAQKHHQ